MRFYVFVLPRSNFSFCFYLCIFSIICLELGFQYQSVASHGPPCPGRGGLWDSRRYEVFFLGGGGGRGDGGRTRQQTCGKIAFDSCKLSVCI